MSLHNARRRGRFGLVGRPNKKMAHNNDATDGPPIYIYHGAEQKRYVMGITSIWLLVPILFTTFEHPTEWEAFLLLMATATICVVSTLTYWMFGTPLGPWFLYLDKAFALALFVGSCLFFYTGHGARSIHIGVLVTIPCAIAIFFIGSRVSETVLRSNAAATACHLTFRYIGFWWVYLAFTPPRMEPLGFWFTFTINSSMYWLHILYSVIHTGRSSTFQLRDLYIRGCLEVCCLSVATFLMHRSRFGTRWVGI